MIERPSPVDLNLPCSFGRYTLLRCLSQTSQEIVYLASDSRLDRRVALKMPNFGPHPDAGTINRFYRAARLAARITHPNLCPVYDVDCVDGVHFLTMAYIEGTPLTQRMGSLHRWLSGPACSLVRKLALALQQLHERNLGHREVTADKILLQPDGNPVLMDLGLGVAEPANELTASYQPGVPSANTASGDLYALGALLFHLLTGEAPSTSANEGGGTLITSLKLAPRLDGIDPALLSLCADVMSSDTAQRPPNIQVFADRLQIFSSMMETSGSDGAISSPTLTQPPSRPASDGWSEMQNQTPTIASPPRRKPRSRRWLLAVVPLLLLALGIGATAVFWPQDTAQVELRRDSNERIQLRSGSLETVRLEVQRNEVTDPLEIQVVQPIEGVDVSPVTLPTGATSFTLQLRASADAPLQRTTLQIEARTGKKVRGTIDIPIQIEPQSFRNSQGMPFVLIPAGRFRMGAADNEKDAADDEHPQHEVEISEAFYLSVHEVTQQEYQKVMGSNPSYFAAGGLGSQSVAGQDTSRFPVESVSWDEAKTFCARLSQQEGEQAAQRDYRLPTEAEWEYACRGGVSGTTRYHFGETLTTRQARFDADRPIPVGQLGPANGFGLHDMHGNVAEWCSDWYLKTYYQDAPKTDPKGPTLGVEGTRLQRGGAWNSSPENCRTANRDQGLPDRGSEFVGLRIVCILVR